VQGLRQAEDTRVGVEIRQLELAVTAFKTQFNVPYMPSRMILRKNLYYDVNNSNPVTRELEKRSQDVLRQMFPRLPFSPANDGTVRVNWNNGPGGPTDALDLNGAECLVFFLGGLNGTDGWSPSQTDPINGAGTRIRPAYEFDASRLRVMPNRTHQFKSYVDLYDTNPPSPYIYFSSYKVGNDYTDLDAYTNAQDVVRPYVDATTGQFVNKNSFQIISAGRDGLFGTFTFANTPPAARFVQWRNGNYTTTWDISTNQKKFAPMDNLSNFHGTKLGTPQ
jgi:hypothetical protein